jgi:hypothetical protein
MQPEEQTEPTSATASQTETTSATKRSDAMAALAAET